MMELVEPASDELDLLLTEIKQYYAEKLVEYRELPHIDIALAKASNEVEKYSAQYFGSAVNRLFKIEVDGRSIGCLWYLIKQDEGEEPHGFLAYIYIDSSLRRQGFAQAALMKYEELIKGLGAKGSRLYVFKGNEAAVKLYRQNDYVVLCERHFYEATEDTRYYMYKPL